MILSSDTSGATTGTWSADADVDDDAEVSGNDADNADDDVDDEEVGDVADNDADDDEWGAGEVNVTSIEWEA